MSEAKELGLPEHAFDKQDSEADLDFYSAPRLVTHIDDAAVAALTRHYASLLKPEDRVLDLMSSWVSHLPPNLPMDIVGHGMNADELAANPRLNRWFVQDLNCDPVLVEPDAAFDAVLICVGVQYLQHPLSVFRDLRRVLRPGGVIVVSYSNRCFPTKAVAIWRHLDVQGQAALIRLYCEKAGFSDIRALILADGRSGDPLIIVDARA